ncbi:hypothetical protein R1sor_024794 [Riccia sorocarpa]|uniref:Uncharacterized protein n=1 Tax=Riccia sorocarpa TaxID=122646 RepID=A0ABD3GRP2_9MARC
MVTSASVTVWCDSVKLVLLLKDDEEFAVVDETVLASAFKLEERKGSLFVAIEDNDDHLFGVEDSLDRVREPVAPNETNPTSWNLYNLVEGRYVVYGVCRGPGEPSHGGKCDPGLGSPVSVGEGSRMRSHFTDFPRTSWCGGGHRPGDSSCVAFF